VRAGPAFSTISKVKKSQISTTYKNILRLADWLKVDVATLFSEKAVSISTGRRTVIRPDEGKAHKKEGFGY
jgi:hypothetical protein